MDNYYDFRQFKRLMYMSPAFLALSPEFFLTLRLLVLAMLESGAPLNSSLEEALYKCSICMNE